MKLQQVLTPVKLLFFIVVVLFASACEKPPKNQLYIFDGQTMGTYYRVSIVASPELQVDSLIDLVEQELEGVNQSMSTYLASSEVSRFNRASAGEVIELSEPTAAVVDEALTISTLSLGAFDITVGPLVRLWGFGADGSTERRPDEQTLLETLIAVGREKIELDGRRLLKSNAATEIDLSAIAKGYAIDQVGDLLREQNLTNWLIDVGGELLASGENLDRTWQIAIEKPSVSGGIEQVVELRNQAIATSGDYRNYVLLDGNTYSHAIDPATGYPVRHSLASVSVLHERAATADALATALLIMGTEKALQFAETQNLSVFLISRAQTEGKFNITKTGEFTSTSH